MMGWDGIEIRLENSRTCQYKLIISWRKVDICYGRKNKPKYDDIFGNIKIIIISQKLSIVLHIIKFLLIKIK